jgi:hypothetical protein
MKKIVFFLLIAGLSASQWACTKTEPEPILDLKKLEGTWRSTDFPFATTVLYSSTDQTAKITQVATNTYSFRVNDIFWKEVVPTGEKTFRVAQLSRSTRGYYVFVTGRGTLTSDNALEMTYVSDSDDTGLLKLDGKRVTFAKQ